MTQGIYNFPPPKVEFTDDSNSLPPFNVEAEEAVLGGILLDPQAINLIKDKLLPEHFYIGLHQDIYKACIRLHKSGKSTDLISVVNFFNDREKLAAMGGRMPLVNLVNRTVTSVNIDVLADIVVEKAVRRQMIKLGKDIANMAYNSQLEIPEIKSSIFDKTKTFVEMHQLHQEDTQRLKHDFLLQQVSDIYTTCAEPSLRFFKLHELAHSQKVTMNFLEHLYLKSLTAQCSKLLDYEELKELAGSTVREWLVNGLVPKNTTICLVADGGAGKTKFAYGVGKLMIQGSQLGSFHATGEKRRILYYQGDESPGDMWQALETLGYGEDDINKYVKVRFGWSAENIPALIQDLKEFQPDFVVIDSLSTANRFSVYQESQMEYARPILEMTGLAAQHQTTFLIIHHTNRDGGVRGTTAIRNAVSEVWRLNLPKGTDVMPNDRILEIDKSRSRSSGKKYRMFFNPENLSFEFLGEETDTETSHLDTSAKKRLMEFFVANRNIKFTSEELSGRLEISAGHCRKCLGILASDGMISCIRKPGLPNRYFLAYEGGSPLDHPGSPPADHTCDQPSNPCTTTNTAKGDPPIPENDPAKKIPEENFSQSRATLDDQQSTNTAPVQAFVADHPADHTPNSPTADHRDDHPQRTSGLRTPSPFTVEIESPLGKSSATITPRKIYKNALKMDIVINFTLADGTNKLQHHKIHEGKKQAETLALKQLYEWRKEALLASNNIYEVQRIVGDHDNPRMEWIPGCRMVSAAIPPHLNWFIFEPPLADGEKIQKRIQVTGEDEFRLMKPIGV